METIARGITAIDLRFMGRPRVIASCLLQATGTVALIDPGPSTCLPALRQALRDRGVGIGDIDAICLTHIHLDHAGATGTIVRENARIRVMVHERGARHMANPERLLASARRLYGDNMERLWGEVAPVPAGNLQSLAGGECVEVGGRSLEVAYTPGHASHHVSYFDKPSGVAFVGDTGGVRIGSAGYVAPPTPPPDVDIEAWSSSVAQIERWHPDALFMTHFGLSDSVVHHLQTLLERLDQVGRLARASLEVEGDDAARAAWFAQQVRLELWRHMPETESSLYELAAPIELSWQGLARYWRKRTEAAGAGRTAG